MTALSDQAIGVVVSRRVPTAKCGGSLRVPPFKKRLALSSCVDRVEDKNVITHRSSRF